MSSQLEVELQSTKALPFDKARAFLNMLQESEKTAQSAVSNYKPDSIDWQLKDTNWMAKLKWKESGNQDLTV